MVCRFLAMARAGRHEKSLFKIMCLCVWTVTGRDFFFLSFSAIILDLRGLWCICCSMRSLLYFIAFLHCAKRFRGFWDLFRFFEICSGFFVAKIYNFSAPLYPRKVFFYVLSTLDANSLLCRGAKLGLKWGFSGVLATCPGVSFLYILKMHLLRFVVNVWFWLYGMCPATAGAQCLLE